MSLHDIAVQKLVFPMIELFVKVSNVVIRYYYRDSQCFLSIPTELIWQLLYGWGMVKCG